MVNSVPFLAWLLLLAPLAAACLITFLFLKSPKSAVVTAVTGILTSLGCSLYLFSGSLSHSLHLPIELAWDWIKIGGFSVELGFMLDPLSILMLLVVTVVGACVFFYSIAYMKEDPSYPRYFACLSLFVFSMLGIVLANNFLMLFVFWELVALSSYLLIGFWFEKPSAADAGNKAFIVNRVADFGLVLGIVMVWTLSGIGGEARTFNFSQLAQIIPSLVASGSLLSPELLTATALLVFCGVVGKSAQFPLYIWLPDAMEGPTPVSALIHAATMVAAGVYLLARTFFLFSSSPQALHVISIIGGTTALLAAILAVTQNDIKKILAYSTVSQLGYMVMAVGLGSSHVAMYHLTTHAFFKALLFLGAGAMIHALHTQNIWEMGGLLKPMPIVAGTFLLGTLALCGIYPLSGFFSKDEILLLAFEHNRLLFGVALFTAALTAFYMSRACWIAILNPLKARKHAHSSHDTHDVHDAPLLMKAPLLLLAALSVVAGFIGIPNFIAGGHGEHMPLNLFVAGISTVAALAGMGLGTLVYRNLKNQEDPLIKVFGKAYDFVVKKYFLDEFFQGLADFFQNLVASVLLWFDQKIVMQKGVTGTAWATAKTGSLLRRAQTGRLQTYVAVFGFGLLAMIYWVVLK